MVTDVNIQWRFAWCCSWHQSTGPALSRLDRLLPICPGAKGGPTLRLRTYANLHFQSKLLVWCMCGPNIFFKRGACFQRK